MATFAPEVCADLTDLVRKWKIDPELAQRFRIIRDALKFETGRTLTIISGHRTCEEQQRLSREGRPTAACDRSNHTVCPATAIDVRISGLVTDRLKADLGRLATQQGLRWGYGPPNAAGIPEGWNHLDFGPRTA